MYCCFCVYNIQASDASILWRGLELSVYHVVNNTRSLLLPFYNLKHEADVSKNRRILLSNIYFLDLPTINTYPTIKLGDFVMCWRNHSVIDMFAYSLNGDKYFIQVSVVPYRQHSTQLPDLFTHRVSSKPNYDTVYDFYSKCTDNTFVVDQKHNKFAPKNEYYIYITTSVERVQKIDKDEQDIFCISGYNLDQVLWKDIAKLFEKK